MWLLPETGGALWIYSITHLHGPVVKGPPRAEMPHERESESLGLGLAE